MKRTGFFLTDSKDRDPCCSYRPTLVNPKGSKIGSRGLNPPKRVIPPVPSPRGRIPEGCQNRRLNRGAFLASLRDAPYRSQPGVSFRPACAGLHSTPGYRSMNPSGSAEGLTFGNRHSHAPPYNPTHPKQGRRQDAFTFVEVFAALVFLAILVPAIVEGLGIANRTFGRRGTWQHRRRTRGK